MRSTITRPTRALFLALVFTVLMVMPTTAFALTLPAPIDQSNFPDQTWRQYVLDHIDTNQDAVLSQQEADAVTDINVEGLQIASFEGIECFANLQTFNCSMNKVVTKLDLRGNPKLEKLNCASEMPYSTPASTEGKDDYVKPKLTELDLSGSPLLTELRCAHNPLTTLDLSNAPLLKILDASGLECTVLDIQYNLDLVELYCKLNRLDFLDISHHSALEVLDCRAGTLKTLTLLQNNSLRRIDIDSNDVVALDVTSCSLLETLEARFNEMTELDLSGNPQLKKVSVLGCDLASLDLTNCFQLESLDCSSNKISSLNLSHTPALSELLCDNNLLTELDVSKNPELTSLDCRNNAMEHLDLSQNKKLSELSCGGKLKELDVSANTELVKLACVGAAFEVLDVKSNTKLKDLTCSKTRLASLDVSKMKLERLDVSFNQLRELNIDDCSNLETLICENELLTRFAPQGCQSLSGIHCSHNELSFLDLSQCPSLQYLDASYNHLLDVLMPAGVTVGVFGEGQTNKISLMRSQSESRPFESVDTYTFGAGHTISLSKNVIYNSETQRFEVDADALTPFETYFDGPGQRVSLEGVMSFEYDPSNNSVGGGDSAIAGSSADKPRQQAASALAKVGDSTFGGLVACLAALSACIIMLCVYARYRARFPQG